MPLLGSHNADRWQHRNFTREQNVPEEYKAVSYFPVIGRVTQLLDWEAFREYQMRVRQLYLPRNIFPKFLEIARDRRRRHGLEGDVFLHPEPGLQSQLQNWIEFQNYHIELHEGYESSWAYPFRLPGVGRQIKPSLWSWSEQQSPSSRSGSGGVQHSTGG